MQIPVKDIEEPVASVPEKAVPGSQSKDGGMGTGPDPDKRADHWGFSGDAGKEPGCQDMSQVGLQRL